MSLANLAKVLKCSGSDDIVTLKANDDGDTVTFMFESPSELSKSGAAPRAVYR
jgi:proliferating cell nuclear antigen